MPDLKAPKRRKFRIQKNPKRDYTNARLIDDDFFGLCFNENTEAAQVLVDRILGIPGLKVVSAKAQERIYLLNSKTVALDLLAKTETGEEVDIEVQRSSESRLGRRARYYLSTMTARMLKKGDPYEKLRDAYVLFICEHDPFGKGRPVYSYAMRDKTAPEADFLNDGASICFFNCAYKGNDALGKLASDMLSREWRSIEDPVLKSLAKRGKINSEGGDMSLRAEAHYERGYFDGREERTKETVIALLRDGTLSPEQIAKALNIHLDEVFEIRESIKS